LSLSLLRTGWSSLLLSASAALEYEVNAAVGEGALCQQAGLMGAAAVGQFPLQALDLGVNLGQSGGIVEVRVFQAVFHEMRGARLFGSFERFSTSHGQARTAGRTEGCRRSG